MIILMWRLPWKVVDVFKEHRLRYERPLIFKIYFHDKHLFFLCLRKERCRIGYVVNNPLWWQSKDVFYLRLMCLCSTPEWCYWQLLIGCLHGTGILSLRRCNIPSRFYNNVLSGLSPGCNTSTAYIVQCFSNYTAKEHLQFLLQ